MSAIRRVRPKSQGRFGAVAWNAVRSGGRVSVLRGVKSARESGAGDSRGTRANPTRREWDNAPGQTTWRDGGTVARLVGSDVDWLQAGLTERERGGAEVFRPAPRAGCRDISKRYLNIGGKTRAPRVRSRRGSAQRAVALSIRAGKSPGLSRRARAGGVSRVTWVGGRGG